jgi:hypothetical protein
MKESKPTRQPAIAKPQKVRGNMCPKNIQRIIMTALDAYAYQSPGISFDDWRAEEVMAAVRREGLSCCDECHFCDLMGHFCAGAGREDEALQWFLKAGKNTERQIAWSIAKILSDHIALAQSTVEQLTASTPSRRLKRLLAAREALLDHPDGPLDFGDLLTIARGKTRRPTLTLDPDNLAASLADRCDKLQLALIRFTITNRRNEREGRGNACDRNKSQKSETFKSRRSPHETARRPGVSD